MSLLVNERVETTLIPIARDRQRHQEEEANYTHMAFSTSVS